MRLVRNLVGLAGFLLLWEATVRLGVVDGEFLPPPSAVLATLATLLSGETFLRDLVATTLAWLIAVLVAVGIAVPAGLLLGSVPVVRAATRSLVEFLRPVPPVALIPLVVVLIGSGPEAKISLAAYASVWPILFNIVYALDDIDPLMVETVRSFGGGRLKTTVAVALPHAAPFAFTGLRLAAAIALVVTVSTEYLAGSEVGVGAFIIDAYSNAGRMDLVLAGTVVVGLLGYLVNEGLERLGRRLFRWSDATVAEAAT